MAIEAKRGIIRVLVLVEGTEVGSGRISGVDGIVGQSVVSFQMPNK